MVVTLTCRHSLVTSVSSASEEQESESENSDTSVDGGRSWLEAWMEDDAVVCSLETDDDVEIDFS